jgi:two-component system sensor histidine kinase KdpD
MSERRRRLADETRRSWLGYTVAVGGTAAAAGLLLIVRAEASKTNVVLAFLAVVFAAATAGGLGPGLVASALGFLAFDFLFLPPYHTLVVRDPQDYVSLGAYLAVAVAVSALVGLIRRRQAQAELRERETRVLYELSASLVARGGLDDVLGSVTRTVRSLFDLAGCAVLLRDGDRLRLTAGDGDVQALEPLLDASGDGQVGGTMLRVRGPALGDLRPGQTLTVPMHGAEEPVGALVVVAGGPDSLGFGEAERRVLATFANQAALAVEQQQVRDHLARTRALEETDRLRSALLNSVSHDLRTPLASIKGSVTSLLDADVPWDERQRSEFLRTIDAETDRLTHLVDNLLDSTRLETGAYEPDIVQVRLADIVEPAVERARARTSQRIDVRLDSGLPVVLADPVRLDQILTNLLDNANRYAPGSPITLRAAAVGSQVELRVADHGPGVPETERERIFEQFYRLKGGGRRPEGTGMGLAICRGIADVLGGGLHVETTPGGGATFVLRLPIVPDPDSRPATAGIHSGTG